jgi:hypothetical protein
MKKEVKLAAGMWVHCKYRGKNGDLIVGQVRSVRTTGDVIGINALTGNKFRKEMTALLKRNDRCSKKVAMEIVAAFNKNSSEQEARECSVAHYERRSKKRMVALSSDGVTDAMLHAIVQDIETLRARVAKLESTKVVQIRGASCNGAV